MLHVRTTLRCPISWFGKQLSGSFLLSEGRNLIGGELSWMRIRET